MLRKLELQLRKSKNEAESSSLENKNSSSLEQSKQSLSHASSTLPHAENQKLSNSEDHHLDQLGLRLVCDISNPNGDIIFVHGLGGMAKRTWCWKRNIEYFWPPWLVKEDELSSYRIFVYGYNSNFKGAGTNLNIIDFAKDLLFQMLTFSGGQGNHLSIGHRAIVFVTHSMGGLVVKKAFILGKHDPEYASLISKVYGMLFLATPHRGAHYAKMLNNILSTAPLGAPPKAYIADLDSQSSALQDINEQFRTSCGGLALVSFFETLKTNVGPAKVLIVNKDSGILGYPQEISNHLNADHHSICKFQSREDENYINVKNVLKLWATRISLSRPDIQISRAINNFNLVQKLEMILGIRETPEDELTSFHKRIMDGTCQWITQRNDYVNWIEQPERFAAPQTFWLIGLPATGKTSLATSVVRHLQFLDEDCQYHFFSSSHQAKRTAAYGLRSIALQLALAHESFRKRLFILHEETGITFTSQNQNFNTIWDKVFEDIIFKIKFPTTLFWVFDGVDEVDSHSLLLGHLMKIKSLSPIKIFLTSRPMKMPPASASYVSSVTTYFLSEKDTWADIRTYVHTAVRDALPDDEQLQKKIVDQVLAKASGSFLWVKLTLETLGENWHTEYDIQRVLNQVPESMESLYNRLLDKIRAQSPRLQLIASRILAWTACCWRPLSIVELQVALEPEFGNFIKLEETINQICGHFITLERSKVSLIHDTARHFILSNASFIDSQRAHEHIAIACLRYLSQDTWRRIFKAIGSSTIATNKKLKSNRLLAVEEDHPFLDYAACFWAYHVSKSLLGSQDLMSALKGFLLRYGLTWIEAIALSSNLRYLTRSAQYLKVYSKRKLRRLNQASPLSFQSSLEEDAKFVQSWANNFIRIVGKFGVNLVQSPQSIYQLVPPFCPRNSEISRTYGISKEGTLSVSGLPSDTWDDCLASVSIGDDGIASKVLATDTYFIILVSSSGTVHVWFAETCECARKIYHKEYVRIMSLNKSHTLLATAGIRTYRVWDISSGKELYCIPKSVESITMAVTFSNGDSGLIIGFDDCSINCYDLRTRTQKWIFTTQDLLNDLHGCPKIMAFSPDATKVVLAWRGKPPIIWDMLISGAQKPQRYMVQNIADAISSPEQIIWQTNGNSILVLCQNTSLIEWHLYDEELTEFNHVKAHQMTLSQDGNFLLTNDNMGSSVWTFPALGLIYRVVNENEFIRGIAFSPDGQRFYDIRGSMCHVWEPDALVRPDDYDLEDHSSLGESYAATEPVFSTDENSQCQVTALASDSEGMYYCCGREDGTIIIHEGINGKRVRKVYSHSSTSSVIALDWSRSGKYVISGDNSGRIIAKRLEKKKVDKWSVFPVLDFRLHEPAQQFLFGENEQLLLISAESIDCVWDLKAKKELCRRSWGVRQSRRWIQHPFDGQLLLWIDPVEIQTYNWKILERSDGAQALAKAPSTPVQNSSGCSQTLVNSEIDRRIVRWIALTDDKRHLVYETRSDAGHSSIYSSGALHLGLLSTLNLQTQPTDSNMSECLSDLAGQVRRLLGTYENRIVFLNQDSWLCSWKIDTGLDDVQNHFFLPKDWLNRNALQIATLNAQGTLFCPKYGNVAIVRHGLNI